VSPLDFTCPRCKMPGGAACVTPARRTTAHKARGLGLRVRVKDDSKDIGVLYGLEVYWPDNVDTVLFEDGRMFDSVGTELEVVP